MKAIIPNNEDQRIENSADRITIIAGRLNSHTKMEGRNPIQQAQWMIDEAKKIIEWAEVIKIANLPKEP